MALLATELAAQNDGMLSVPLMRRDVCIMESPMNVYYQTVLNLRCCTTVLVERKKLCFTVVSFKAIAMPSRIGTHVINNEMGRTCGTIERQNRYIRSFVWETREKEPTLKTQA